MIQEDKQLLIKDLCERLPYGIMCTDLRHGVSKITEVNTEDGLVYCPDFDEYVKVENCHLYLRPMSSMTEDEEDELNSARMGNYGEDVDWLNAHHFDYRIDPSTGKTLIESGLAIEAYEGIYKTN